MKKLKNIDYYNFLSDKKNNSHTSINTDSRLFLTLIFELILYLIMLIPNILGFLLNLILLDKKNSKNYIEKITLEPFNILQKIIDWFFEAKYTSGLIILLCFCFIIEFIFLQPYMNSLMIHQLHFSEGNYYSIITSIFLHADWLHLLSNSIALLIFGRIVEKELNSKIILIFLGSGIVANIISTIISLSLNDLYYSLGASGAIAGIIMFAILLSPFSFTNILIIPLPIFVIGWGLILLDIIGVTAPSTTNHLAHLGGYSTLLILFFFLELKHRKQIIKGFILNLLLIGLLLIINNIFNLKTILA